MQEEFDALWSSPFAVGLADFVVRDLDRLSRRELVGRVDDWREDPEPASAIVEAPVYRQEVGLWQHQKHFVKLAFDAHRGPHGARFVLADEVGLGKTLQLAMAAQLMALAGERPVLVLAPRSLVRQWQDEIYTLLGLPSAICDGRRWIDERGIEHPGAGPESIRRCPRRIGIVSTGPGPVADRARIRPPRRAPQPLPSHHCPADAGISGEHPRPRDRRALPHAGTGGAARRVGRGRDRPSAVSEGRLRSGGDVLRAACRTYEFGLLPHPALASHGQHHGGGAAYGSADPRWLDQSGR